MVIWSPLWREKKYIIFLFTLSLVVRALFFICYTQHDNRYLLAFDSDQYHTIAVAIAYGKGITNDDGSPNVYRLPGYPLFLGGLYKLSNYSIKTALWVQLILASIIPLLIFLMMICLLPGYMWQAKIVGILAALHTGFIMYAGILSTESLFLFFFMLFCMYFFSGLINRFSAVFLYAGFFLGCASLIRPVGQYLIVLSLIMMLVFSASCRSMLQCFMSWLVPVSWWLARNYLIAGALFFHTLPGLHFLQYSAVNIVMQLHQTDYFSAKKIVFEEWDASIHKQEQYVQRELSEYERYACAHKLAFNYIVSYPLQAIRHAIVQIARTCCTLYSSLLLYVPSGTDYTGASLWFKMMLYFFPIAINSWTIPLIYWEMITFFWMISGVVFFAYAIMHNKKLRRPCLMTLPFIVLLIGITLAYGCARLRFAVDPFLLVYAVCGWTHILGYTYEIYNAD